MSSFVNRGIKVFAKDDGFLVTRKRSEGRMKRYESAHDLRAWCLSDEEKRRYLIELMQRSSGSEGAYGKYIPVPTLISTMMALKDVQIEDLEKALAAYRSLNLTDEQRAQLDKQLGQSGDKNLKAQDSTTVLFRRKEKLCRCAPPMEKQELMTRIRDLQDELERRDKEAKRQMSCLEKCIAKEKRRVEKVKQSLASERRSAECARDGRLTKSTPSCAERADNALRQVDADQSTICALECKLSALRAANLELQSLLDAEKSKPFSCDPKQSKVMQEMQDKMAAAQSSEAAMRDKLSSLESFLRRSSNSLGRPSVCTGPNCVKQRRSCKDRPQGSTPPGDFHPSPMRSQSISPNRSRCSLPSDDWSRSSGTDRSRSPSNHRCRPPFVSTPGRSLTDNYGPTDVPETGTKCGPCAANRQRQSSPPPGDTRSGQEVGRPAAPQVRTAPPLDTPRQSCHPCSEKRAREERPSGEPRSGQEVGRPAAPQVRMAPPLDTPRPSCQPCSEKRAREERLSGEPRSGQEVSRPPVPREAMAPPKNPFGSSCQQCSEKRLREENIPRQPPSRQERSRTPGPQIGLILDSSGSFRRYQPCARRSSSGGPEFNTRREQEQPNYGRVGTGHRDCWRLMVSQPKKASSRMSDTSEESEDSLDNAIETRARDYVTTSRSPSPLTACHKHSCPASPAACRSQREPSPVAPRNQAFADSFRIVSETCRAPTPRRPSPSAGQQQTKESACPGPNATCPGPRDPSPVVGERNGCMDRRAPEPCRGLFPLVGQQKGLMDARIPVPNVTCRGAGTRAPSPVMEEQRMTMERNNCQSPVTRELSPIPDDRRVVMDQWRLQAPGRGSMTRDQSPTLGESRGVGPKDSAFADRRVVLDASKVAPRRGRSPKSTERRNLTPNALGQRKSPVGKGERRVSADINRGPHVRRQSPMTLDGRPVSDPRRAPTACRPPVPIVLHCSSREPSPANRCTRPAAAERPGCPREASPRPSCSAPRSMQCELVAHPALRKSVPFSNMADRGRCANQAKRR